MANKIYNGVSLPDIEDVWDKDEYDYATIAQVKDTDGPTGRYLVCFSVNKGEILEDEEETTIFYGDNVRYQYNVDPDYNNGETGWRTSVAGGDGSEFITDELLWANYDVLNPDGSVYLKGEGAGFDKESFLVGLSVGFSLKGG